MILGVGIDLIEVARIERALSNRLTGERFKARVFTPGEIDYCERRKRSAMQSYAARFAAKEATMKVLGEGLGAVGWHDIEVRRDGGIPRVVLHGRAARLAAERSIRRWHLSLTHTETAAAAVVIAEGGGHETPEAP